MSDKAILAWLLLVFTLTNLALVYFGTQVVEIGNRWNTAVDGNSAATQASRLETTWKAPPLDHAVMTFRQRGEPIPKWVDEHISEYTGCMAAMERK